MKWITLERPKIDRIACPWLIARFIDKTPEFIFAPTADVRRLAAELGATPLAELATIVRGADTARLELAPQAAGLLAISLGLSHNFRYDQEQLRHGFVIYDALYAWSRHARQETHTWNPQRVA